MKTMCPPDYHYNYVHHVPKCMSCQNFIKIETPAQVFSCLFCEFERTCFYRSPLGDYFWKGSAQENIPTRKF